MTRRSELEEFTERPIKPGDRRVPWRRIGRELREQFFQTEFGRAMRFTFWIGAVLALFLVLAGLSLPESLFVGASASVAMALAVIRPVRMFVREVFRIFNVLR